jgi:uncharacterized RDD family membrane protein YckC
VAQQANLLTAVCGSLAAVLVFRFTQLLTWASLPRSSPWKVRLASITSASLFAFSPLVWQYSVGSEVFALNNLLVSLLLVVTAQFARFPTNYNATLGAFICGLAMCNQHTAVLFEAPLILWVLWIKRSDVRARPTLALRWGIAFLCGLLPYIYLPLSSTFNKQHGSWGDSSSVAGFIHHLRRGDYGTFQLFSRNTEGAAGPYERAMMYASDFTSQQAPSPIVVVVAVIGMVLTLVRSGPSKPSSSIAVAADSAKSKLLQQSSKSSRRSANKRAGKKDKGKVADAAREANTSDQSHGSVVSIEYLFTQAMHGFFPRKHG